MLPVLLLQDLALSHLICTGFVQTVASGLHYRASLGQCVRTVYTRRPIEVMLLLREPQWVQYRSQRTPCAWHLLLVRLLHYPLLLLLLPRLCPLSVLAQEGLRS